MFHPTALTLLIAVAGTAASAQTANGDDFVLLNQERAMAGDAASGDAPGYPLTLSKSGSYKLGSNLVVPAGADGIVVNPGVSVVIDLNGFQIVGAAACTHANPCGQQPGTAGVRTSSDATMLTVRNGRIRGFTEAGVSGRNPTYNTLIGVAALYDLQLWSNSQGVMIGQLMAERIHAKDNSGTAVAANYATVQDSMAFNNYNGFSIYYGGRIANSMAISNQQVGYNGGPYVLMHYNTASGNKTNVLNNPANSAINRLN